MLLPALRDRAAAEGLPFATVAAEAVHVLALDTLFARPAVSPVALEALSPGGRRPGG